MLHVLRFITRSTKPPLYTVTLLCPTPTKPLPTPMPLLRTPSQSQSNDVARTLLDDKRGKLDAARKKYAVLRRKLDDEFNALDSLEAKVGNARVDCTHE